MILSIQEGCINRRGNILHPPDRGKNTQLELIIFKAFEKIREVKGIITDSYGRINS